MSEALRLDDALEMAQEAADELRRLHEAHDWQYKMAGERLRRIEKLEALNTELLEALKGLLSQTEQYGHRVENETARAAIAKAEGEKE